MWLVVRATTPNASQDQSAAAAAAAAADVSGLLLPLLLLPLLLRGSTGTSSALLGSHLLIMDAVVRQGGQLAVVSAKASCICTGDDAQGRSTEQQYN
jgi:hypothetical protein